MRNDLPVELTTLEQSLLKLASKLRELQNEFSTGKINQEDILRYHLDALLITAQFLDKMPGFESNGPGTQPNKLLWDLAVALDSITKGVAHPMLIPKKIGIRSKSLEQQVLMGWAAIAFNCLQKQKISREIAGKTIAKELQLVRLNQGRDVAIATGRTVAAWLDKCRKGSAPENTMKLWNDYSTKRQEHPEISAEHWTVWSLKYLRALIKNRLILQSPPKKVED